MEQDNLDILKNIERLEVSDALFDKIALRIEAKKVNTIPLFGVGIAASLLFALLFGQAVIISKSSDWNDSQNEYSEIVEINNNALYHE